MIPLLPRWNLNPNRASFYDTDSATLLELASTLHATMNTLIEDYNNFVDSVNNTITEFTEQTTQNQETFEIAIRQEFQDFINIIDLKIAEVNNVIASQNNKINEMEANQVPITQELMNNAIKAGQITITETYNSETESLDMVVTGGV